MAPYGTFNEEAMAVWNFARCQKADGTIYGTGGTCRIGTEIGAKAEAEKSKNRAKSKAKPTKSEVTKEEVAKLRKNVDDLYDAMKKAEGSGNSAEYSALKKQHKKAVTAYNDKNLEYNIQERKKQEGMAPSPKKEEAKSVGPKPRGPLIVREGSEEKLSRPGNQALVDKLVREVPEGTRIYVNPVGGLITVVKTRSGHTVETKLEGKNFDFKVNGKLDVGSVKDRKEQIEVANAVRRQFEALVRALPNGAVIETGAHTEDGRGESRAKAYQKMGFSKPHGEAGASQYARKEGDRMVPTDSGALREDRSYNFSEVDSLAMWMEVLFPRG
jgi:hypothetical protein